MELLLAAFAVFFVYGVLNAYLGLPPWAWTIILVLLSAGTWFLIDSDSPVHILSIAGITTIIKGSEALLLVSRDRVTVDILRTQRRT
jgi:hypothetical protein